MPTSSAPSVSVVLPNYNGEHLLPKHLPSVLEALRHGDELIIVDDHSTDQSWKWLQDFFTLDRKSNNEQRGKWQCQKKSGAVLLLRNEQNLRFGASCNRGVAAAVHPYIFLLNTDVSPEKDVLSRLLLQVSDDVFAVGCLEHEGDVMGGKNTLQFRRGMFVHARAEEFHSGDTAWVSGGSGLFDREKWIELGGFDPAYYPAYWEDVDLSARARSRGWRVLFDASAVVHHHHESTNTTVFGQKKLAAMSWQHAHTFLWKHANLKQKILHLLWQPYWWIRMPHFAQQQVQLMALIAIILIALLTRMIALGNVPHGMAWDEAAIGYNGYSIAHTGRDEWLKKLPISFRSFGDYKAPLAIYINGASTLVFGLTLFAIRLPFALAGIAAVVGVMALLYLLWEEWQSALPTTRFPQLTSTTAALLAGFFIAVSPWHIHYSRIGFESGMALSFLIWSVVFFLLSVKKNLSNKYSVFFITLSAVCAAASLYTYHSSKITTPIILSLLILLQWPIVKKNLLRVALWIALIVVLLLPLAADSLYGQGGERFQQASLFGQQLPIGELSTKLIQNSLAHLAPSYLFQGATSTLRHGDGKWGILFLTDGLLCVIALVGSLWYRKVSKVCIFALGWILAGTLPAIIGVDAPHSNRMLLALPGFLLLAIEGWQLCAERFDRTLIAPAVLGVTLLLHTFFSASYLQNYFTHFARESASAFSDGYSEVMEIVKQYEPDADKVLFTSKYQQPYIYALLSTKTRVYDYHNGSLVKYEFSDKVGEGELLRRNTVIVGTPDELDPKLGDHLVYGSDGAVRFVVIRTP